RAESKLAVLVLSLRDNVFSTTGYRLRYKPNAGELLLYHYLIDSTGKIYNGKYRPEDNLDCTDDKYAMHTGGLNTGSIGVSFCGMLGFKNNLNVGYYPLTRVQCESGWKFAAGQCKKHKIPTDKTGVKTHYEVGLELPKSKSAGKIDITCLPYETALSPPEIGDYIRKKVGWYLPKM
ncbi:hypothetical protein tpqmel_0545, partial [Candidatus Gastranaerophilus sp. (ex Termes propinquus)]